MDIVVSVGVMESEVDIRGGWGCLPRSEGLPRIGMNRGGCFAWPRFARRQFPATAGIGGAIESGWNLKQMLKLKEINGAPVK